MSTAFEQFFDGNIFVINLDRRPDRLLHFSNEMKQIGVEKWHRFDAIDAGPDLGNHGCSASHRAVLDIIVQRGLRRAFIFEDDATLRDQFIGSFNEESAPIFREVPDGFQMLYLGGHYAEDPRGWFSPHLILMGAMKTTSSYGVTLESARELRDLIPIGTGDSIDNLYSHYNATKKCYITEPRFFVQYNNYSDLQKRQMNNSACMEDNSHVARLGNIGRKGASSTPKPTVVIKSAPKPEPVLEPAKTSTDEPLKPSAPLWNGQPRRT